MNEFDLIKTFFAPLAGPEGLKLQDDAAVYNPPSGFDLIITKDSFVEGVHFPSGECSAEVAERLLRTNLSDLAAKAASPRGYLLSVAWPKTINPDSIQDFASGLKNIQSQFGISLWGGDTVSIDGPAVLSATCIGVCPEGMSPKRFGAQPKDDIWLSGYLGKGYFGLKELADLGQSSEFYYKPAPRIELQKTLRTWASSSIDVSDGFAADLLHIAKASRIHMKIDLDRLFWPDAFKAWMGDDTSLMQQLLTHGDDYEVIFTAHADYRSKIKEEAEKLPFELTRIGLCDFGSGIELVSGQTNVPLEKLGYSHF